jgi:delta14-sterol reductase
VAAVRRATDPSAPRSPSLSFVQVASTSRTTLRDESFVLGVLDFTSENMGWMLTWGNIMFVGFMFALPASVRVAEPDRPLPWVLQRAAIVLRRRRSACTCSARPTTRSTSSRLDPELPIWGEAAALRCRPQRGTKLLLSGWWGVARKINYSGDILLALCHGLASGFDAVVPHIYFIYLTALLLHRAKRDEAMCKAKYGADWARYSAKVPYKFVPGIY